MSLYKKIVLFIAAVFLVSSSLAQSEQIKSGEAKKAVVDYNADISNIKNKGEFVELLGNVVFYHNGVFITCDTAYRYSEQHMEGVGNVIINSDSTFIYGDKFIYNGETNIARVFAPLIKTVDNDVVLYTHNMEFNTLENTGIYFGGGTATQGENLLESDKGVYYSNERKVLLADNVEMKNENYKIATDSLIYNFDSEIVTFLTKTNIWNHNDEFLIANRGFYNTKTEVYDFYDDAYILTKEQELWADSIVYRSQLSNAELNRDIQILDTLQRVISFGDEGYYWGKQKRVLVTKEPSIISYSEDKLDSTFMRADTMLVVPMLDPMKKAVDSTVFEGDSTSLDSTKSSEMENFIDNMLPGDTGDSLSVSLDSLGREIVVDSLGNSSILDSLGVSTSLDSTMQNTDSLSLVDSLKKEPELSWWQRFKARRAEKAKERNHRLYVKDSLRQAKLDAIKNLPRYDLTHGKFVESEDGHDHHHDHEHGDEQHADSLEIADGVDSLMVDGDSTSTRGYGEREKAVVDSSDYFIYGIGNVKNYMSDAQMVCDSMVVNSLDSTFTLYVLPLIWSETNQISADSIRFFTRNSKADMAELYNFPILSQHVQDEQYNQIKGKYMESYFKDNSIDVLYVDGNSETVYYREEEDKLGKYVTALINVTSANMEIYFDSSQIADIKWFSGIQFNVYPIEKVAPEATLLVEGFEWKEDLRPLSRYDISTRIVKPSKREEVSKIIPPVFDITEAIEEEKISLTRDNLWRDRNEPLPVNKDEFVDREL